MGLQTVLGSGSALAISGGQRARIALARALYSGADVVVVDDPLSACDAKVAERIMKDVFVEHLKGRTRLMATHSSHFRRYFDHTIRLAPSPA